MAAILSFLGRIFQGLLGLFTVGMAIAVGGFAWGRFRRGLGAKPFNPLGQGRMDVQGLAAMAEGGEECVTPLTHSRCIAYEFSIGEGQGGARGTHTHYLYRENRGSWNVRLQISQAKELITLEVQEWAITKLHFQDRQHPWRSFFHYRSLPLLQHHGISPRKHGFVRSLTLEERIIRQGDRLRVLGQLQRDSQGLTLTDAVVTDGSLSRLLWEGIIALLIAIPLGQVGMGIILHSVR